VRAAGPQGWGPPAEAHSLCALQAVAGLGPAGRDALVN